MNHALHLLVNQSVPRQSPAVRFEMRVWSYDMLERASSHVAATLRAAGVGSGDRVGIRMARSPEQIAAVLGVLGSGAAYVPLAKDDPHERTRALVAEASLQHLIADDDLDIPGAATHRLDAAWHTETARHWIDPQLYRRASTDPSSIAYVMFTSGSTGRPKGVMVHHAAAVNYVRWRQAEYGFEPSDRVLVAAPLIFDGSIAQMFSGLTCGGTLVLADERQARDPYYLARLIDETGVTLVGLAPQVLDGLADAAETGSCGSVKWIFSGGDALSTDLAQRLRQRFSAKLYNAYGPTETTVAVSVFDCSEPWEGSRVPIGRPIGGAEIAVVGPDGEEVPDGEIGELLIGGPSVARGYLGQDEATRAAFVVAKGRQRAYRSGDLARRLPDGSLDFLGRADGQTKVRGNRVELVEIETELRRNPGVAAAVARIEPGPAKRLIAYVVPQPSHTLDHEALGRALELRLPGYMVPSAYVTLPELPLLTSGKVDVAALPPAPAGRAGLAQAYRAPENAIEACLVRVWETVLDRRGIGVDDEFALLGGDSLRAIKVLIATTQELDCDIPFELIVENKTIAELAIAIEDAGVPRREHRLDRA